MSVVRLTDEQVFDYLDGNLSPEERQAVEWQIALSEENRKLVEEYRALYGQLETPEVYSMPPSFEQSVLDQIAISRRQSRWFSRLTIAAVLAFVIAAGIVLYRAIDFEPLAGWLMQLSFEAPSLSGLTTGTTAIFADVGRFVAGLGFNAALFTVAVAVVALFHLLDSALIGARFRHPAN